MATTSAEYLSSMKVAPVVFDRAHPTWLELISRTQNLPGLYVFQIGAVLLRVGEARDLAMRLAHHLDAAYKPHSTEYLHYHEFFRELLGRPITIRWLHTPMAGREEIETKLRHDLAIVWEDLMKQRRRKQTADFGAAARKALLEADIAVSSLNASAAPAVTHSTSTSVGADGGLPRERQRAIFNGFPELEEYSISADRLNWRLRSSGRAVGREFASTGNGYVWGRDIPGTDYVVDARGWVNVRHFGADELRRIITQSIRSMKT